MGTVSSDHITIQQDGRFVYAQQNNNLCNGVSDPSAYLWRVVNQDVGHGINGQQSNELGYASDGTAATYGIDNGIWVGQLSPYGLILDLSVYGGGEFVFEAECVDGSTGNLFQEWQIVGWYGTSTEVVDQYGVNGLIGLNVGLSILVMFGSIWVIGYYWPLKKRK